MSDVPIEDNLLKLTKETKEFEQKAFTIISDLSKSDVFSNDDNIKNMLRRLKQFRRHLQCSIDKAIKVTRESSIAEKEED